MENKCQQHGRSKATRRPGKSAELPKEGVRHPTRGQGDLKLTREDGGYTVSAERKLKSEIPEWRK
jgi:hypothetical protein